MLMSDLEALLREIARQGLQSAPHALLRTVAERIWYHIDIPDLSLLEPELRPVVGYLVSRLLRVNTLDKERKMQLMAAIEPFLPEHPLPTRSRDPLAVSWGITDNFSPRFGELLPYQTRHYAAEYLARKKGKPPAA
ncbi:hypothetical protein DWG20_00280 [Crenobacter cavernae]|uniref:Uncharacterized protein n=1 Tax=Crenobacter cavernae TaxID=2290923 RepID=A0A345Y236_9NEIS|nr:hypothetical protein DWG20_00280 [Crenobacter cavernae]